MSAEVVVAAIADLHRKCSLWTTDVFGPCTGQWGRSGAEAKQEWLTYLDTMRATLRDAGVEAFTTYAQDLLSREPDVSVELLQALYHQLGDPGESWGWEDFERILNQP